jgi:hypothetical protein
VADNLTTTTTVSTIPNGTVIATDEVGSAHVQIVKLMDGTDGGSDRIQGTAANGLEVDVTRLPALAAGTNNIGDVDVLTLPEIPAGTNNIGDVDVASIAAGDNNIGNVDVVTLPALPAGTNNIGDVDVLTLPAGTVAGSSSLPAGTNNIGDVDVLSVVPGTGATNLGKAEDDAHTTGDVGVMTLVVRQDTQSALGADGDYVPLTTDSAGSLRTTGDLSAAFADVNATLATAVTKEQRVVADILVADAGGNAMNRIRSAKDAIAGVGGGAMMSAGVCGLDGSTFRPLAVTAAGSLIPGTTATALGKAEDAAHTTGDTGVMALAVRQDTQSALAADGDYIPLTTGPNGSLRTVSAGYTDVITSTLTRPGNTTAYQSGDEVADTGAAVITLTGMTRFTGGTSTIAGVSIAVSSNWTTKPSLELWLFDTTNAPATDNAAFDPTDAENDTLVAVIPISSTFIGDATAGTGNFIMDTGQISVPVKTSGSANLFMRIVIRNAGQAGANSDTLKFKFRVWMD